ncbi:hypothetical protein BDZ94DRAFT_1281207 [Collybia nuda]|uniref:Uncharacterized protein n=1 Tax=Collybia nuda TaxID=64659 RepID=A0A9P5YDH4_9AGAR|nr:hypothetical protein BDZ94DRAFT_1281207 [Collybia nuda]
MPVLFAHLTTRAIEVTIFACTWIAVHPNIPAADDTLLVIGFRRAGLVLCGMVVPEIIILWAMRQWYSARKIGQEHKAKGWTITHGFFLQMGGFMMCDRKNPPYPIQLDDLVTRYAKGEIDWPEITECKIRDRSKGDAFSKGVVVFQTSWFLIQCIGRGAVGLAITELELVTLAFAALNAVT